MKKYVLLFMTAAVLCILSCMSTPKGSSTVRLHGYGLAKPGLTDPESQYKTAQDASQIFTEEKLIYLVNGIELGEQPPTGGPSASPDFKSKIPAYNKPLFRKITNDIVECTIEYPEPRQGKSSSVNKITFEKSYNPINYDDPATFVAAYDLVNRTVFQEIISDAKSKSYYVDGKLKLDYLFIDYTLGTSSTRVIIRYTVRQ